MSPFYIYNRNWVIIKGFFKGKTFNKNLMKYFYSLIFLLLSIVGTAQCDVYIVPGSSVVVDHNPGISFGFEIQNDSDVPYLGGVLYIDWALSNGAVWNFGLNGAGIILPNQSKYIGTPVFDIPLPENVPGNWDPYAGWTGANYFPPGWKLFLDNEFTCHDYVTDITQPNGYFNNPLSDGCDNPDGDNFCNDACNVEVVNFNFETAELTIIPYSTYCPNLNSQYFTSQYPFNNPYIFGFQLNFNWGIGQINISIGNQDIYASNEPITIDLSILLGNIAYQNMVESINEGEFCDLILTIYNLNNTGGQVWQAPDNQSIELLNLCEPEEIPGCTIVQACNYNPEATVNDGSCDFESCVGCMDPDASNYNPEATINNPNLCIYDIFGCTDETAFNYSPLATVDDGSCIPVVVGCMIPIALNYNPEANITCVPIDECCIFPVEGCTDPEATNYTPEANVDDGSCEYDVYGCTNLFASNYNPFATVDDGSCLFILAGCTDPLAVNYNSSAIEDDGSCVYDLCGEYFAPNTFTPNNDGLNDGWAIITDPECWLEWQILIYDRWGRLVWESYIPGEVWIGSNNNGSYYVADGVYVYLVRGIGYNPSNTFEFTGTITIFR